ncbi:MAG: thioredoxin domain-containing protein [Propioniciclava sp.]|uniref:DsbA family protein n=1 Tax=Propioniciclava sp. TaxID=2038686 RepID=UPI0039E32296
MSSQASNRREQLRRQQEAAQKAKRTQRIVGIVAAVVVIVLVGILVFALVNAANGSKGAQVTPPNANADKNALVVAKGREGTPLVTLYADYQCSACASFEENYGTMLENTAKAGDWTLQTKTMTFMEDRLRNTASLRAAVAASCSDAAGVYWAYNREVFANQESPQAPNTPGYTDELLRDTIPAKVGITGDALTSFQQCYDQRATNDFVEGVERSAYDDGVNTTPTITVNGKKLDLNQAKNATPAGIRQFILDNA